MPKILSFRGRYRMCVVMCESPVSNFVTGLWKVCNYGYSFFHGYTWYYCHSVSCSYRRTTKEKKSLITTKYAYCWTNLMLIFFFQILQQFSVCNVVKIHLAHWYGLLRKVVYCAVLSILNLCLVSLVIANWMSSALIPSHYKSNVVNNV